jgi:hypothetical protein
VRPSRHTADVIELVAARHAAAAHLAALTGSSEAVLLQKPGAAEGGGLVMTAAFVLGFALMLGSSVLSWYAKRAAVAVSDSVAQPEPSSLGTALGGRAGTTGGGPATAQPTELRKRR